MTAVTATFHLKAFKGNPPSCSGCHRLMREGAVIHIIDGQPHCAFCGDPDEAAKIKDFSRAAVIERIKAGLKARSGKVWSVTGGKGTAYGWLRISAPKKRLGCSRLHVWGSDGMNCTDCGLHYLEVRRAGPQELCASHVCTSTCRLEYVTPEDRVELAQLLGIERVHQQGEQVAASHDYYAEFIDRAEGRAPRVNAQRYWD